MGDSDSPLIEDHQALLGGGIKPNKFEGKKKNQPSALCPITSAFQGESLGNSERDNYDKNSKSKIPHS